MDNDLLIVGPSFFGYGSKICEQLNKLGISAKFYDERADLSTIHKILVRLEVPVLASLIKKGQRNSILKQISKSSFRHILFISSEVASRTFINYINDTYHINTHHYLWDSVDSKRSMKPCIHDAWKTLFFFDVNDAIKYSCQSLPLFYEDNFMYSEPTNLSKDISTTECDVATVASVHSDRLFVLSRFAFNNQQLQCCFYLFCPTFIHYLYARLCFIFLPPISKKSIILSRKSLSKRQTSMFLSRSQCIIDIQHPKQTGLTSRSSETLAMKKILVTTNFYAFHYMRNLNIYTIDRKAPRLQRIPEFIDNSDNQKPLSLEEWCRKMLLIVGIPFVCLNED